MIAAFYSVTAPEVETENGKRSELWETCYDTSSFRLLLSALERLPYATAAVSNRTDPLETGAAGGGAG